MREFDVEQLLLNPRIRNCEFEGNMYFGVVDVLAVLRDTDFKTAQNSYHVIKNRMRKNGLEIPTLRQLKAKALDGKSYLTDFATQSGINVLVENLKPTIQKEYFRINIRQDDEQHHFHPQIKAFFELNGWLVEHHFRLAFGSQIDIIATMKAEIVKGIFIVECKPRLGRRNLYAAIGQVLCYRAEYGERAIPVIATYTSQINDYVEACCKSLGIRLLAIDMLEYTTIQYDEAVGFDLVTEMPLLPKKTRQ